MTTREAASASTAHVIAVVALQMIREDPALLERLKKHAATEKVPFRTEKLNSTVLEMSEMALTEIGARLARHDGPVDEFDVAIPRDGDNYERSAGALAVASFTTEYVHADTEVLRLFNEWLHHEHPEAVTDVISRETIQDADHVITLMAHVTDRLAAMQKGGKDGA
jgi:hypothetical protein